MSTTSATTAPMSGLGLDTVAELAAQLRVDSIRSNTSAGSERHVGRYAADPRGRP